MNQKALILSAVKEDAEKDVVVDVECTATTSTVTDHVFWIDCKSCMNPCEENGYGMHTVEWMTDSVIAQIWTHLINAPLKC